MSPTLSKKGQFDKGFDKGFDKVFLYVDGGVKMVENRRFEIPYGISRSCAIPP